MTLSRRSTFTDLPLVNLTRICVVEAPQRTEDIFEFVGLLPSARYAGLKLFHTRGDPRAPIHDIHFLARAWQLPNTKAKELGWVA